MTVKRKYLLAGLAAAAVGLTAASAIAHRGHHWDGAHKGRHMGHGGTIGFLDRSFAGPQHGRFCRGDNAEFVDVMLVRLEHRLSVTDEQKAAFDAFKQATRAAVDKLREGCPEDRRASRDRDGAEDGERTRTRPTPVERLARQQARLESSLEALKAYRPAAEAFYAALSDEQKQKLNERRGKRHAERGGKRFERWDRGHRHERGERRRDRDRDRDRGGETEREAESPDPDDRD